jgi:phenylpyruvate tautomerase PptA (4-oxalocrotonate tautomerase family)
MMPLVRISMMQENVDQYGKKVGDIVYNAMRDVFNVPEHDHFQVITGHDNNSLIYSPEYLGIERSDGIIIIQITLNSGRSVDLKKEFYQTVAGRLHALLDIRKEDVFISLVEVSKENWSFGHGIAQYAE